MKLVANSAKAPMPTGALRVAMPYPTTASGGISAVAMATPTIVSPRPRMIAKVPASAANSATARSNRLGRVRATISAVGACNGETSTSSAVKAIAATAPISSAFSDRRSSRKSKSARLNPKPRIGFISGEISIAPITTAGDDSSSPSTAIPADIIVMNAKRGLHPLSSMTRASTAS